MVHGVIDSPLPYQAIRMSISCRESVGTVFGLQFVDLVFPFFTVHSGSRMECNHNRKLVLRESEGTIASIVSQHHGMGTSRCPWIIQAKPGQRINITLVDFGLAVRHEGKLWTYMCEKKIQADNMFRD